jgi:hypothetical protein
MNSQRIGGTFAFLPTHNAKQKKQKSHQANAQRHCKMTRQQHDRKEALPPTRVTVAQLPLNSKKAIYATPLHTF